MNREPSENYKDLEKNKKRKINNMLKITRKQKKEIEKLKQAARKELDFKNIVIEFNIEDLKPLNISW